MAEGEDGGAAQVADADAIMEEIFARKGPQKYLEGLSEENWEEEIEQVPLFMTSSPESVDPLKSPALAALQDIKFQEETPHGRALVQKEEGNEMFKRKRYKEAIAAYTAGVREKTTDSALNAVLYCNRAAAHYHMGNYRSSLMDALQAKKFKPDHMKAVVRGALVCIELGRYGEAMEWCDEGLRLDTENARLRELRVQASKEKKRLERDQRKAQRRNKEEEDAKKRERQQLLETIESRGIHLSNTSSRRHGNTKGVELDLTGPHPPTNQVHLDGTGSLVWPVMFLYPEHGQTDLITAFHERQTFAEHLEVMFGSESPGWDGGGHYLPATVEIYYEQNSGSRTSLVPVPVEASLNDVIASKSYTVVSGTPSFIILSSQTGFRDKFIDRYIQH